MLLLVASQTQGLQVEQVSGLSVAGEAVYGFDMVRFRGLKRDTASALTATMAVAKERHRFEVHATGTLPIFVLANLGFPVNVVQVASRARVVRLWRFLFPRHLDVLGTFQHVAFANAEIVASTVLANALGRRDVVSTTQSFDSDPERVDSPTDSRTIEVVGDPIIVGPSGDDS